MHRSFDRQQSKKANQLLGEKLIASCSLSLYFGVGSEPFHTQEFVRTWIGKVFPSHNKIHEMIHFSAGAADKFSFLSERPNRGA